MRVFIIARGYPTEKYKMNGIFEFDQAKALVEAGVEIVYIAVDVRSIRRWRKWGYESLDKNGVHIEVVNVPCGRLPKNMLNKIQKTSLIGLYEKAIEKYGKPDIIHSHFVSRGHITAVVFKNTDIPLIHTEHFSGMNQENSNSYYQNIANNTYKYMDKVIAVSKPLTDRIKERFGVEATIIPNIVDTSIFKYAPRDKSKDGFKFISVGNLIKRKGMDLLINSFHDAFKDNQNVKLYIYGDGPERKALSSLINKLNLTNQVFLKGLVNRQIIAKRMHECDCFVLASKLETFGVAYIEALAAGLPVIATNCGGPEEFVHKDNGILIEVDDAEALTNSMLKMYSESDIFNREKISKEMVDKFSPEIIAKRLTEIYRNVLKDRRVQR